MPARTANNGTTAENQKPIGFACAAHVRQISNLIDIIETRVIAMRLEEAKILHQGEWTSRRPLSEKEGGL